MPPFVNTKCANCHKPNRYDLAELRKKGSVIEKSPFRSKVDTEEEYEVTCEHCGRKFKFPVTGGSNG